MKFINIFYRHERNVRIMYFADDLGIRGTISTYMESLTGGNIERDLVADFYINNEYTTHLINPNQYYYFKGAQGHIISMFIMQVLMNKAHELKALQDSLEDAETLASIRDIQLVQFPKSCVSEELFPTTVEFLEVVIDYMEYYKFNVKPIRAFLEQVAPPAPTNEFDDEALYLAEVMSGFIFNESLQDGQLSTILSKTTDLLKDAKTLILRHQQNEDSMDKGQ